MGKWRYKIIPKATIKKYVDSFKEALRIEIYHQSKPGYHLEVCVKKETGETYWKTLGRVSKRVFDWYELEQRESSGYFNISHYYFK